MIASEKEYERRLSICKKCPNYTVSFGVGRCRLCGCILAVKAKIAAMVCPEKKWG